MALQVMFEKVCCKPCPQILAFCIENGANVVPPSVGTRLENLLEDHACRSSDISRMSWIVDQDAIPRECYWISVWSAGEGQALIAS
jgi:hypothetical protein